MCNLTSCEPAFKYFDQYIGIKIFLSCINICKVQVVLLKTEPEARDFQQHPRDLANANAMKNKVWSLLLHKFSQTATKQWKCISNYCSVYRPNLFWFLHSQWFFDNILDSDHGQLLRLFSFITLLSIPAIDNLTLPFFSWVMALKFAYKKPQSGALNVHEFPCSYTAFDRLMHDSY